MPAATAFRLAEHPVIYSSSPDDLIWHPKAPTGAGNSQDACLANMTPMDSPPLWSFAVLSDTHVEADQAATSNRRLDAVVDALRLQQPAFVLHLGDVIHPLPNHAAADAARAQADRILSALPCPVHITPGNHDIGDKPLQGMPAAPVLPGWRQDWIARHGPDFSWFDRNGWRVLMVNAPILNRDEQAAAELDDFLARVSALEDRRPTILCTHYPLFLENASETGNYDNIDDPARQTILDFCARTDVRAVFTGHIHNYLYRQHGSTRLFGAPAVSFVRRDFSEIADVAPLDAFGREDPARTGFLWVDVHDDGLGVRMIGTGDVDAFGRSGLMPGAVRRGKRLPLGVNLRHDWARAIDLPFNPPVAAFARRRYRDDATFRAIVELGVRDLRIPAADLLDPDRAARLAELHALGRRFSVFQQGPPSAEILTALDREGPRLDAVELICAPGDLDDVLAGLSAPRTRHDLAIWFAPLLAPDDAETAAKFRVRFGFDDPDAPDVSAAIDRLRGIGGRTGLVFACPATLFCEDCAAHLSALARREGMEIAVMLERLADDTVALGDDADYAAQVAEILTIAQEHPRLRIVLDTLVEFDRGYHARAGLVDRRMTPTAAGRVLRNAQMTRRGTP